MRSSASTIPFAAAARLMAAPRPRWSAPSAATSDLVGRAVGRDVVARGGEQRAQALDVDGVLGRDDERRARAVEQLFGRTLEDEPPAVDHDEPVADLLELGQHVRGHEHGPLAARAAGR